MIGVRRYVLCILRVRGEGERQPSECATMESASFGTKKAMISSSFRAWGRPRTKRQGYEKGSDGEEDHDTRGMSYHRDTLNPNPKGRLAE